MDDHKPAAETSTELPPAVISPNKISTNANIKERLNLHVKRRLQETTDVLSSDTRSLSIPISSSGGPVISGGNLNHHRRSEKSSTTTAIHHGRGGKRSKTKHSASANANAPLNAADDECSRDGENSSCNDSHKEKDTGPDLLTMVLNEKKRSLMRSPEVISFLESIIGTLRK